MSCSSRTVRSSMYLMNVFRERLRRFIWSLCSWLFTTVKGWRHLKSLQIHLCTIRTFYKYSSYEGTVWEDTIVLKRVAAGSLRCLCLRCWIILDNLVAFCERPAPQLQTQNFSFSVVDYLKRKLTMSVLNWHGRSWVMFKQPGCKELGSPFPWKLNFFLNSYR